NQIRRLCRRALWLDGGRVRHIGPMGETLRLYEHSFATPDDQAGPGQRFMRWELARGGHTLRDTDQPFALRAHLRLAEPLVPGHLGVSLFNDRNIVVAGWAFEPLSLAAGHHMLDVAVPQLPVQPGTYQISFTLFNSGNNLNGGELVERWVA